MGLNALIQDQLIESESESETFLNAKALLMWN